MKYVLFYSETLNTSLLYRRLVDQFSENFHAVIEVPLIPKKTASNKLNTGLLKKLLTSSFYYNLFNVLVTKGHSLLAWVFKTRISDYAKRHHIPVHYWDSLNPRQLQLLLKGIKEGDEISGFNATAHRVSNHFLDSFPGVVYSYHSAPLPEYRGAANSVWMLLDQHNHLKGTWHRVISALDAGPILGNSIEIPSKIVYQNNHKSSLFEVWFDLRWLAHSTLVQHLPQLGDQKILTEQTESLAAMHTFPKKNDLACLRKNGHSLLSLSDLKRLWYWTQGEQCQPKWKEFSRQD